VALGGAAQYGHGGQQRRSLATLLAISPLTPAPRRRRLRILVADDSRDTVATLTTLLQAEGHEVRGVHRSADVLGAEREFRPDVVILDLQMPEISGYDLARWMRSRYRERAPLLIALSGAYTRPADATLSRAAGFDHYLTKPYAIGDLLALLA
jgi:DNA-binding response OmpR family regulator